ncbi:c-type cytochrome biogenesis protein CcmI [Granulosicoccus antarcticus]|uniref:Uncharacterized protein n=1 Tax=Granulosicoccus antarcticus IMCC3135 TaxID=1192854 RepID=A0A2Z2NUA7_9GAMM|nr:c-type cytochrome biogenesis protein CcmI [Granulosicoccus antarcticus]ASJ75086.1 hypothetical protein IMCC3135_25115 [Granulosicoccus antarcticus IMCC3135]
MTLFFISAALLVGLCLSWLLLGLFRSNHSDTDQEAVNITLARERRATLDEALANGSIDQASHDYEREQLEYDLASELKLETDRPTTRKGHMAVAIIVAIFVPVAAGALYLQLGNPTAILQADNPPQSVAAATDQAPALADLLPQLEARLAAAPDDVNGWRLLGRSYLSVNEFSRARGAFERALALEENDVTTLAQLAESIAMTKDGDLSGESLTYLERANLIDPDHEHTLWLLAIARQQTGDHEGALQAFDRLAAMSQDNAEAITTIDQMRARSLEAMAGATSAVPSESTESAVSEQSDTDQTSAEPVADTVTSVQVSVSLSDAAKAQVSDDNAVFIYARASEGPPMPLAVSRLSVRDLPATITLDDSMAMIPNMTLSAYPSVTIGARVSPSGNPLSQPGDWFSEQNNVLVDETDSLNLIIDTQTP